MIKNTVISITGGKLKGRLLKIPKGRSVRPTTNRIRESIFNILHHTIQNTTVLDLFAGSGALGIEALSRGASKVVFVENSPPVCRTLRENIEQCNLSERSWIICKHFVVASKILQKQSMTFDLIFADPPYDKKLDLIIFPLVKNHLKKNGLFVFEQPGGRKVEFDEKEWFLLREKRFGSSWIWFFKLKA